MATYWGANPRDHEDPAADGNPTPDSQSNENPRGGTIAGPPYLPSTQLFAQPEPSFFDSPPHHSRPSPREVNGVPGPETEQQIHEPLNEIQEVEDAGEQEFEFEEYSDYDSDISDSASTLVNPAPYFPLLLPVEHPGFNPFVHDTLLWPRPDVVGDKDENEERERQISLSNYQIQQEEEYRRELAVEQGLAEPAPPSVERPGLSRLPRHLRRIFRKASEEGRIVTVAEFVAALHPDRVPAVTADQQHDPDAGPESGPGPSLTVPGGSTDENPLQTRTQGYSSTRLFEGQGRPWAPYIADQHLSQSQSRATRFSSASNHSFRSSETTSSRGSLFPYPEPTAHIRNNFNSQTYPNGQTHLYTPGETSSIRPLEDRNRSNIWAQEANYFARDASATETVISGQLYPSSAPFSSDQAAHARHAYLEQFFNRHHILRHYFPTHHPCFSRETFTPGEVEWVKMVE
ncbi:hypothetical protein ABW19_dt0201665 [Dactylella cylindrospora]|nr:hypothetical protein ABW19_dt0201665 [Dactylella cylindrospora]